MEARDGLVRLVAGGCTWALALQLAAQEPRLLYGNISSSNGFYTDAIVLLDPSGGTSLAAQRPLVQEGTDRCATIFPRRVQYRRQGTVDYVYWVNTFAATGAFTGLLRGADRNGNGTVDESEIEPLFAFGPSAAAGVDEAGGVWWVGNAARSGPQFGLWRLQDGNGDGDFFDAGEAMHVIATPTVVTADPAPGPYTTSSDDLHAVAVLLSGADAGCVLRADLGAAQLRRHHRGHGAGRHAAAAGRPAARSAPVVVGAVLPHQRRDDPRHHRHQPGRSALVMRPYRSRRTGRTPSSTER